MLVKFTISTCWSLWSIFGLRIDRGKNWRKPQKIGNLSWCPTNSMIFKLKELTKESKEVGQGATTKIKTELSTKA